MHGWISRGKEEDKMWNNGYVYFYIYVYIFWNFGKIKIKLIKRWSLKIILLLVQGSGQGG